MANINVNIGDMCGRSHEALCSAYFFLYNGTIALYGN